MFILTIIISCSFTCFSTLWIHRQSRSWSLVLWPSSSCPANGCVAAFAVDLATVHAKGPKPLGKPLFPTESGSYHASELRSSPSAPLPSRRAPWCD